MILPYTKIVGLTVYDFKNQRKIGQIKDVVFEAKNFKVSGLTLEGSFLERKAKIVNSTDVIDIGSQGVIVNDSEAISSIEENVRLKDAIKSGCHGIGQKVVTKGGKGLGRVIDLFVETETLEISKIHVKNIFTERIISRAAIIEMKKKKIIVKENFEAVKMGAPAMGASVI